MVDRDRKERDQTVADEDGDDPHVQLLLFKGWRASRIACITLVVGVVLVAALTLTSLASYNHDEKQLLQSRARDLGLVVTEATTVVQTPLGSAGELADASYGNPKRFKEFMSLYVGSKGEFSSAVLLPADATSFASAVVDGAPPLLMSKPNMAHEFLEHGQTAGVLNVTGVVTSEGRTVVGYEFSTPSKYRSYSVYVESPLTPHKNLASSQEDSSFSDLNYAIYLGRGAKSASLIATSLSNLPITGVDATDVVPFGNSYFTLVVSPRTSLISGVAEWRPWLIAVLGFLIVGAAVVMVEKLARRREQAEELARELDRVAGEQRGIAQRLQRSLLPEKLPELDWLQMEALYVPATAEVDVGGDWYDAVVSGDEVLLVVGDVAGHGLQAATRMAYLRHSLLAYAAQDCGPASILSNLSALVNNDKESYFATVLCILVHREKGEITIASAGHPPPLLWDEAAGSFIEFKGGVPLGIAQDEPYEETTVPVSSSATLVAFTDGLIERPGEHLDIGLARLQAAAIGPPLPLHELLAKLVADLTPEDYHDDTAVVGIRWEQIEDSSDSSSSS